MSGIGDINNLSYEDFITFFHGLVEQCPLVAAAVWDERPFADTRGLQDRIDAFVDSLPSAAQIGILRLHPDLAGKMAAADQLTPESTQEQKAAGLDSITKEEQLLMNQLNERYKKKFGFPFVICARENKKDAILKYMQLRLNNDRQVEITTGIAEVKKICWLRLNNIVSSADQQ